MWIMMHKTEVFPLRKWWLVFMLYFLSFSSMYYQNFCVPLKTVSEIDVALLSNHRMNRLGFKTLRFFLVSPSSISHVRAIYSASSLFASIDGRRVAQTQVRGEGHVDSRATHHSEWVKRNPYDGHFRVL